MVFGEVNAVLSLWDRLKKWWDAKKNPPVELLAARFIRLFESHGVHRNQIPRFFGHGLTLKDVQDDTSLIAKLDEPVLEAACTRFAVRREWLDGAEYQIYCRHDFYKHPEEVENFLKTLKADNPDGELDGVLLAPEEEDGDALLVLYEIVGYVGDKPIRRYHLCDNWVFHYWKSRAYLTAFVAIAWKNKVYIHGAYMPKQKVQQMGSGEILLSQGGDGIWEFRGKKWYPEDMALRPEVYLKGVDPERNDFGIRSSLNLWLDLEQQGYMDTGITGDARQLFERELAKYQPAVIR